MWYLISGKVNLKIKRTSAAKYYCNHPSCKRTDDLRTVSKQMRYHIAIEEAVFLPQNVVACAAHINVGAWKNVNALITKEEYKFTTGHIEEMFQLLTYPPKTESAKESSLYQ